MSTATATVAFESSEVTLHHGDCLDVLASLPDASVDSVVTDPPYGLEFMGRDWDAPWRESDVNADAGMSATGYTDGGVRLPRPSFTGSTNPKCLICKGTRRGRRDGTAKVAVCLCEDGGRFPNVRAVEMRAFGEWCESWAVECLRVLKPGGHMLAFGGTRTWHRLAVAVEDAGFEVRDSIAWLYAQGFPKSLNVGGDKAFCQCPVGEYGHGNPHPEYDVHDMRVKDVPTPEGTPGRSRTVLLASVQEPGTPAARREELSAAEVRPAEPRLEGRSDAQAPSGELHSPADGSLSSAPGVNVARERVYPASSSGDGGVDWASADSLGMRESQGSRHGEQRPVESGTVSDESGSQARRSGPVCGGCGKPQVTGWGTALKPAFEPVVVARKPLVGTVAANVLAYGTGALNIDVSRIGDADTRKPTHASDFGSINDDGWEPTLGRTKGSAHGRFPANVILDESQAVELDKQSGILKSGANPTSRNSDKFRNAYGEFKGQRDIEPARGADEGGASRFFYSAKADSTERPVVDGVAHPTVKPLDLMRYLVRLVTPRGGVVLEPFAGSGTTLEAAVLEGFRAIGIEREADYIPLITKRLDKPHEVGLDLFGDVA